MLLKVFTFSINCDGLCLVSIPFWGTFSLLIVVTTHPHIPSSGMGGWLSARLHWRQVSKWLHFGFFFLPATDYHVANEMQYILGAEDYSPPDDLYLFIFIGFYLAQSMSALGGSLVPHQLLSSMIILYLGEKWKEKWNHLKLTCSGAFKVGIQQLCQGSQESCHYSSAVCKLPSFFNYFWSFLPHSFSFL